jgi:outer membrane protein
MRVPHLSLSLLVLCASAASAQGWSGALGVGVSSAPRYVGGDEYKSRVIPYIQLQHGNRFVAGLVPSGSGFGVGTYLVRNPGFTAAVDIAQDFSREERYGAALAGMGDRRGNTLVGTSLSVNRGILSATSIIIAGLAEDAGATGSAEIAARRMMSPRLMMGLSAGATLATQSHMQREFGISVTQAARRQALIEANDPRLGIEDARVYTPQAGLKQTQVGSQVMYAVSERRSIVMFWQYTRLSNEAFASSLVRTRTSANTGAMLVFGL